MLSCAGTFGREVVFDGEAFGQRELWEIIQPLLAPKPRRFRNPGRKPLDDRKALTGILFVLKSGGCCPRRWAAAV